MKKMMNLALSFIMIIAMITTAFAESDGPDTCWYETESLNQLMVAYMDLDQADAEIREQIMIAREKIIYSNAWVADGVNGYVTDTDGNIIEVIPHFSEIFPADWDIPTQDIEQKLREEIMPISADDSEQRYFFAETLELSVPPVDTNSKSFCSFNTSYFSMGLFPYHVARVGTCGRRGSSNSIYTYNVGYSNATTGVSLGWKPYIESGKCFSIEPPSNTKVAVRASTYDSPGTWFISVTGDAYPD